VLQGSNHEWFASLYTANEGRARIQDKCLVPIYVFPEMKLLFPKQNYNVLSPRSYTQYIFERFIPFQDGLPILLQGKMWTDPGKLNCSQTHECVNVEIESEAAQFPEKEYINGIFLAV
jgi:hypothetical protein